MLKKLKLAYFLASRAFLRGDKWALVLVGVIMMVVFLNLLFTDAVFSGITKAMNANKINYQYGEVFIEPEPGEDYVHELRAIASSLKIFPNVTRVVATLHTGASFINEKNKDGRDEQKVVAILESINPEEPYIYDLSKYILDGRMLQNTDTGKVLIGANLAGGYGANVFADDLEAIRPGDKLRLEFAGTAGEYEVAGTFKTKNFEIDRRAFILRDDMRRALGVSFDDASEVVVRMDNPTKAKEVAAFLKQAGFDKYKISDWQEKIAFGAGISKSFDVIGQILRFIGALVAGLVIFIVVFVDIANRKRQIGILKAIGIKNEIIILDYILRGFVYTILGIILGYILMKFVIAGFEKRPIVMPMADVVPFLRDKALVMSMVFFGVAGFLGSFLPSYKEIKKDVLTLLYR